MRNDQVVSYEQTYAGSVQVLGNEREVDYSSKAVEVIPCRTNFVEDHSSIGDYRIINRLY